ncbi:MAG: ATP-binding protein [Armatimonadota bacterium]
MCLARVTLAPTIKLLDLVKRRRHGRPGTSNVARLAGIVTRARRKRIVRFDVPGTPEMLPFIRKRVGEFARTMPFTEDELHDIKLAVGEAGANAIRHGMSNGPCRVEVELEKQPGELKISISDHGCGFNPQNAKVASNEQLDESGRGISVMRALMDEVKFKAAHPGTRVELVKRLKN